MAHLPSSDPISKVVAKRVYDQQYQQSEQGRETSRRYNTSTKGKEARRWWHILNTYGLTREQWQKLFSAQGGLCAICRLGPAEHVDHCHKKGKVRALLCRHCNHTLGAARDDPFILLSAAKFLLRA